jgi:hypothetical protein
VAVACVYKGCDSFTMMHVAELGIWLAMGGGGAAVWYHRRCERPLGDVEAASMVWAGAAASGGVLAHG